MEKTAVLRAIRDALRVQFEGFQTRSRQTRAASADPETRAEDKYDTRATEENYLADGQARQAQHALEALGAIEALGNRPFAPGAPIAPGALVRVEFAAESSSAWFFVAPAAGGLEIVVDGAPVMVLTPGSPLGQRLLGRAAGDRLAAPPAEICEVV